MKYAYVWLTMLLLGAAGLVVIVMFETITLNNDSEYYVLKEAMEAAMLESVDVAYFRTSSKAVEGGNDGTNLLKISEQKFIENFTRRFAESISGDVDDYTIDFYDIMEMPPKASVVIKSSNRDYKLVTDEIDISNALSGILETGWGEYVLNSVDVEDVDYEFNFSVPDGDASDGSITSNEVEIPSCNAGDENCSVEDDTLENIEYETDIQDKSSDDDGASDFEVSSSLVEISLMYSSNFATDIIADGDKVALSGNIKQVSDISCDSINNIVSSGYQYFIANSSNTSASTIYKAVPSEGCTTGIEGGLNVTLVKAYKYQVK